MINDIKTELNENYNESITENGAIGYRTTGKYLLDFNFKVPSYRTASEEEIINNFIKVYNENNMLAIKMLFYLRDIRGGLGERRVFRTILKYLAFAHPEILTAIYKLIPEYGRIDDLWTIIDTDCENLAYHYALDNLIDDINKMKLGQSISLLAKWMPSINTSSENTVKLAKKFIKFFNNKINLKKFQKNKIKVKEFNERVYAKILSKLREHIKVVERQMSLNKWEEIDYEGVPSRANLIYNKAFLNHDKERRKQYLENLAKGKTKINASTLFPHDIVNKYSKNGLGYYSSNTKINIDDTLEQLWKALPNYSPNSSTLVVADGSGSMISTIGNTKIRALDVANALAIYFSERAKGEYKDKYITFSERPQLVDFSCVNTLFDKIKIALQYNEIANTNIKAVFDLILNVAIKNHYSQDMLPDNVLIISDMEFDEATISEFTQNKSLSQKLFKTIIDEYATYGYKLPKLVFWNVNSITNTIPLKENELGVTLISGFSPAAIQAALTGENDPYQALIKVLNGERYDPIETALKEIL